jgi:hypothetical protein
MEVNLLEEREDGYHAYCVILDNNEVETLRLLKEEVKSLTLSDTLKDAIEVGIFS